MSLNKCVKYLGSTRLNSYSSFSTPNYKNNLFRCVAVTLPRQYKIIARRKIVLQIMTALLLISLAIPTVELMADLVDFKYRVWANRLSCSLILSKQSYYLYILIFLVATIGINLIFLITYLVLHFNFKTLLNRSSHMDTLKRGALVVTSIAAISYFIGYTPITVVYIILWTSPTSISNLVFPYNLILDSVLMFGPHFNSCLLPLFLASSACLERLKIAAVVTQQSIRIRYTVNVQNSKVIRESTSGVTLHVGAPPHRQRPPFWRPSPT